MPVASLEAERFRGLAPLSASFDARYNLIVGPNASGKTSLLEALFFLGRGRSFRSRKLSSVIRHGADDFQLVGRVAYGAPAVTLGIRASRAQTEIRIGGRPATSAAELAAHFPPHVIDPEVHKLLEDGPIQRRKFVDWGVFHVEPSFLADWQRYHRALRQRNAALRAAAAGPALSVWDEELCSSGMRLAQLRGDYLARLSPYLAAAGRALLDREVTVGHQPGWAIGQPLAEALRRSIDRDRRLGLTHVGPHRADVVVRIDGLPARERISRGQQKLLAAALTLSQLNLQQSVAPGRTALLLDDPAAELDAERFERLVAVVRELPVQLFVTSLRADLLGLGLPGQMFHVEHGVLRDG
jgi:DNA replication and repair protein RecF